MGFSLLTLLFLPQNKQLRRPREVDGYVGFANLPNQVYRKAVKKGFEFSLMVVGEWVWSGSWKLFVTVLFVGVISFKTQ